MHAQELVVHAPGKRCMRPAAVVPTWQCPAAGVPPAYCPVSGDNVPALAPRLSGAITISLDRGAPWCGCHPQAAGRVTARPWPHALLAASTPHPGVSALLAPRHVLHPSPGLHSSPAPDSAWPHAQPKLKVDLRRRPAQTKGQPDQRISLD